VPPLAREDLLGQLLRLRIVGELPGAPHDFVDQQPLVLDQQVREVVQGQVVVRRELHGELARFGVAVTADQEPTDLCGPGLLVRGDAPDHIEQRLLPWARPGRGIQQVVGQGVLFDLQQSVQNALRLRMLGTTILSVANGFTPFPATKPAPGHSTPARGLLTGAAGLVCSPALGPASPTPRRDVPARAPDGPRRTSTRRPAPGTARPPASGTARTPPPAAWP